MTDAISVKTLQKTQTGLQKKFEKAQTAMQDAQAVHATEKAALEKFNNKYGRVLQMMTED